MNKKIVIASALILASAAAIPVFAQTTAPSTATTPTSAFEQPILQVGPAGKALLRGTIVSASSGSITVNSWGGTWTVSVASGATILPSAVNNDVTQFKAGDFIGVQGTVSQSAAWTINASVIRDWTYRAAVTAEQKQNVQAAHQTMQNGPRDYIGTASAVSGTSFTLTAAAGTSYTVNVPSGSEIVNAKWITIPFTGISNGDSVRVYGVNASGTVTARIVRDITVL